MDYEKKYKEALERAKQFSEKPYLEDSAGIVGYIFPELKESEGEKWIPKEIAKYLKEKGGFRSCWLAWLEKQGEPVDKVEPKFHEGDWIIHHGTENIYQVVAIIDNQYQLKYGDTYTVQKCADVDRCARLWDITKDAKDGDILCTYECNKPKIVFILKGTPKKPYVLGYHCFYNIMYPSFKTDDEKGCLAPNAEDIKPATKEQRDTLMKAMADAGYTTLLLAKNILL